MAHPFKKQADASAAAKKSHYEAGGRVPFYEKPAGGAKGSIERMGVNVYRRELGRDPESRKFGGKGGIQRLLNDDGMEGQKLPNMRRGGAAKMTGGAESGVGRIELAARQKAKRGGK